MLAQRSGNGVKP